jgi:hypothetical protein
MFRDWPMILIDLYTNEGVVGHSSLEPYLGPGQGIEWDEQAVARFPPD